MKITVITIALNSAESIEKTMKSVISQDYPHTEYWIIDGGSRDGTVDIIKKYAEKDERIKWISEPDKGGHDAFNKGLDRTTGEIVNLLNSGDEYCDGALKTIANCAQSHPEYDVFYGDTLRMEGDTPLFIVKPPPMIDRNIWHECPINVVATFFRKKVIDSIGRFDLNLHYANDYDVLLRFYKKGCLFKYVNKLVVKMPYGGHSDEKYYRVIKENFHITVKYGYPVIFAAYWYVYKMVMRTAKQILRFLGLHSLIKLHPKFHPVDGDQKKVGG